MRFKKGDKVVVRSYAELFKQFGSEDGIKYGDIYPNDSKDYCYTFEMDALVGKTLTIEKVVGDGEYQLSSDDPTIDECAKEYTFTDEMLKSIPTKEMHSAFPANGEFMVEDVEGGISISFVQGGKTYPVGTVYATAKGQKTTLTLAVDGIIPGSAIDKKDKAPTLYANFLNGESRSGKLHEGRGVYDEY